MPTERRIVFSGSRLNMLTQRPNPIEVITATASGLEALQWQLAQVADQGSIPSVPQNVQALIEPNSTVRVSWSPCPDPDIAYYNIWRALTAQGGSFKRIGHKSQSYLAAIDDTDLVFDWATTANPTTFWFAVEAVDFEGLSSGFSDWVNAIPDPNISLGVSTYIISDGLAGTISSATTIDFLPLLFGCSWSQVLFQATGNGDVDLYFDGAKRINGHRASSTWTINIYDAVGNTVHSYSPGSANQVTQTLTEPVVKGQGQVLKCIITNSGSLSDCGFCIGGS